MTGISFKLARYIGLMIACSAIAGCSSSGSSLDIFSSSKSSASATTASGDKAVTDDDVECPDVGVRSGASTLSIAGKSTAAGADPGALEIRYQGSIVRTARECHVRAGNMMNIKVGVEGRIVLGPAGGPGQIDVPLRLAVVHEGPSPRVIMSKLARIPVTIGPDAERVSFTHVDPDVTFALPKPLGDLDSYVIYVGFDPDAVQPEKPKPAAKRKR